MSFKELLPYLISIIVPIISGLLAFFASTKKSKEDLCQLQEQNKHDLDRLVNQHKLDLEDLEVKHKMDIEKLELEHKHKIELLQKETENNLSTGVFNTIVDQAMKMPEVQNQLRASFKTGKTRKH